MQVLKSVIFELPKNFVFGDQLLKLLAPFGLSEADSIIFKKSDPAFMPHISFRLAEVSVPVVVFTVEGSQSRIEVTNKTGKERQSPEVYTPLATREVIQRMANTAFVRLDHVGFNLPWFDGVHPDILSLRHNLATHTAYYRFPTGEPWDFILPATPGEIQANTIDLTKDRHPKLEIVSFDKSSTPLIQIDFSVNQPFEKIRQLFPEGLADNTLKNVWVYLENPYSIDVCLVIGGHGGKDWSTFFEGHRLSI